MVCITSCVHAGREYLQMCVVLLLGAYVRGIKKDTSLGSGRIIRKKSTGPLGPLGPWLHRHGIMHRGDKWNPCNNAPWLIILFSA